MAALQVTPVHYLFRPDDDAMVRHFAETADATELPVMIYNVVPWTYLSPQLLTRIIDEVPGVIGVKQSAGDVKLLADLLLTAGDRFAAPSAIRRIKREQEAACLQIEATRRRKPDQPNARKAKGNF